MADLMKVRAKQKAKKPNFRRHDCQKKARLGTNWRKPRGLHNKLRQQVAAKGRLVRPGFGSPRAVRGFHPSGFREVLVNNVAELAGAEGCVVRVASAVGMRKRAVIEARAKEMNLRVLNPKAGGE